MQDILPNAFGTVVSVGVGGCYSSITQFNMSFIDALAALEHCEIRGKGSVIYIDEVKTLPGPSFIYAIGTEQQLINLIKIGDISRQRALTEQIIAENLSETQATPERIQNLFYALIGTAVRTIYEIRSTTEQIFPEQPDLYKALSDKQDIEQKYHRKDIDVIYVPILVKENEVVDFKILQDRYCIEKKYFFYTVSQMIPHKNLGTLIGIMDRLVHSEGKYDGLPTKLVISGVNGNYAEELKKQIKIKNLENNIVLTGFISNEERNSLYQNCHTFLFPSVFEGFGMPPIEAMLFKTRVITTKCASIPEVTQGKAVYVDNPYHVDEWIKKIQEASLQETLDFTIYDPERISKQYLQFLKEPVWKKK